MDEPSNEIASCLLHCGSGGTPCSVAMQMLRLSHHFNHRRIRQFGRIDTAGPRFYWCGITFFTMFPIGIWQKIEESNPRRFQRPRVQTELPTTERYLLFGGAWETRTPNAQGHRFTVCCWTNSAYAPKLINRCFCMASKLTRRFNRAAAKRHKKTRSLVRANQVLL